jgi:outer membrane protein TolC
LEITSAYTAFANSRRQVELQQREILPEAEEIFRVANVSYHAGEATYVEFLQALQTLNSARNGIVDALVEYNKALIRLERTLGHIR